MSLKALAEAKLRPKYTDEDPENGDFGGEEDRLVLNKAKSASKSRSKDGAVTKASKMRANAAMLDFESNEKYSGQRINIKDAKRMQGYYDDGDDASDNENYRARHNEEDAGIDDSEVRHQKGAPLSSTPLLSSAPLLAPGRLLPHGSKGASAAGLVDDVDAELEALEAVDARAMMQHVQRAVREAEKGKIVEEQINLNDFCLETRIRLQKPLQAVNRLPPQAVLQAICKSNPAVKDAAADLINEIEGVLTDLCELRSELLLANENVSGRVSGVKRGRDSMAGSERASLMPSVKRRTVTPGKTLGTATDTASIYWPALSNAWDVAGEFRDSTVDTWGRKLTFAGGLTAKQATKLKVVASDISKQVAEVLSDRERVISRSHPRLSDVKLLCVPPADGGAAGIYDEAYDDNDFYQQLLRDFVSASAKLERDGGLRDVLPTGLVKHPSKKRTGIDRRATKGRRLKFAVHPKLVNFAAPSPFVVPPEMGFDLDTVISSMFKSK